MTDESRAPTSETARRCKCGDPACPLWSDDVVCPHCSAKLTAITTHEDFEGRGGDMGEGHYGDCPHGELVAKPPTSETADSLPMLAIRAIHADLKPEARAELAEFEAHLRAHHAVAQLDCRFCLLRMDHETTRRRFVKARRELFTAIAALEARKERT